MGFLSLSYYSLAAFVVSLFGYIIISGLLQYFYYYRSTRPRDASGPIIQYDRMGDCSEYWIPFFGRKKGRSPLHAIFTFCNLNVASLSALVACELIIRGHGKMVFTDIASYSYIWMIYDLAVIVLWESVAEYYWHRLMHIPWFYKTFHKHHHYYKNPQPFDDMFIHPAEAFGYYCILYSPPFIFSCHIYSFFCYMGIMGICGILDHSGIKFSVPYIYDTVDHDNHHAKFEVNYAFPFPLMDVLHGTYYSGDGKLR